MKLAVLFLSLVAFGAEERYVADAAKTAVVENRGVKYVVTWWPLRCADQQKNTCEARVGEGPKLADVIIDREDGVRISHAGRKCASEKCRAEADAWVEAALNEAKK